MSGKDTGPDQAGLPAREAPAALVREVGGPVLVPGSEAYDAECATFNLNSCLRPALVVGATGPADVRAAVAFAAREGMPVAVKSTGHQVLSPAHGGLLVTTGRMRGLSVDPRTRTTRVAAGLRWSEVLPRTAALGLAPIIGSAPEVGVVGYTLGGGQSPLLGRTLGYAADHVRAMDVVTARGESLRVTPTSAPDLYGALLGGKGNFGVVTAIEFGLFPVTRFYGGGLHFRGEDLPELLEAWRGWLPDVPEEMTSSLAVQRLPDAPALPAPLRGAFVAHLRIGYLGRAAEGERLLAPLRAVAAPLLDTVEERPFTSVGAIHQDPVTPSHYLDRTVCLAELTDKAADTLLALAGPGSGCRLANVEIRALGGALDRSPEFPNAIPTRGVPFMVFALGRGGPERTGALRAELARLVDALAPWAVERNMVNFMSRDDAPDAADVAAVFGPERHARLAEVKRRHDPSNLFRFHHNVRPA